MKKLFSLLNKILTVVVVFSLAVELTLFVNINKIQPLNGSIAPTPVNEKQTVTSFERFGINKPVTVDLLVNKSSLARLSPREQSEQVRDWLLFTIAANSGLSKDVINRVTFDLPPIRYGYLEATSHFQFGALRSLYIGNGNVIALIPADSQGDVRADQLAQIADDQRKGIGNIPVTLFVFEYTIAPDLGDATLMQIASITGRDLFTEAAGYYEMKVASLDDLTTFMATINDVTSVRRDPGGVVLGGRKLKSSTYQNIAVEDVAVLWQANETIKDQWDAFDAKWQPRIESYNLRCASGLPSLDFFVTPMAPLPQADSWSVAGLTCDQEKEAIEAGQFADYQEHQLVNGTGFSLDPTYDYTGLREFFQQYRESLMALPAIGAASVEEITAAYDGLDNSDILPMLQMVNTLTQNGDPKIADLGISLQDLIRYTYSFNQARYDGNLQGTGVGMTLFYTDLLAKLWALDFNDSAPTSVISEFRPIPESQVSLVYENEIRRLNNTRLWFGPAKDGFQLTGVEKDLFLGRKSTRVYAASSNPLQPGKEETANQESFAFLNWWDTHYDEIAAYEPQYQRLNEIMKWSLIISWLNGTSEQNELSYLEGLQVAHTYWFPDWVKEHPELRFDRWDDVKIYPRGSFGTQTEVVPVLSSASYSQFGADWVLSGGVSLADLDTFAGIKPLIPSAENDLFLRAGLDLDYGITANGLRTLEKTEIQFLDDIALESRLIATPEESVLLRNIDSDVLNVPVERTIRIQSLESGSAITNVVKSESILVNSRLGANELGTLNIQTKASGFEVGWISRDVDMGQTLAVNMSRDANPLVPLLKDSNVTTVIELPGENSFLVHLKNSEKWMETGIVKPNTADVEWASHVSDPVDGVQIIGTNWVDAPGSILDPAAVGPELRFSASPNGVLSIGAKEAPAATQVVEIKSGTSTIIAKIDPATGDVFVPVNAIPKEVLNAPERLENLVTARDLAKLQQQMSIASDQPLSVISSESRWLEMRSIDAQYSSGKFGDLASRFAGSPEASSRLLAEHLGQNLEAADELIANGQWAQAKGILDDLTGFYEGHPQITLRQSIVQIEQGRIGQAAETLNLAQPMKVGDMTSFYDEVSGLLQSVKDQPNVIRAAQTQEWELLQSKGMLPSDGKALSFNNGNRLELEYHLFDRLDGVPVDVSQGIDLGKPIYVQDSSGLNNLDWSTSLDQSIQTVINGDLGTVIQLPRGDIAHFRPERIFSGDQILFKNVTQVQFSLPTSFIYQPYECSTDGSQTNTCITGDWVYVVLAK